MSDYGCNGCESRWGGLATAHCGAPGCHKTFTCQSTADKHRAGSHVTGRYCLDPETAVNENPDSPHFGEKIFKLTDRKYPCWGLAGEMPTCWEKS